MAFDINALFDDPRFAQGLALFGASGPHNAGLMDAAKTMQHMKQLKAQQEQMLFERQQATQDMAHKEKRLTFDEKQLGMQADHNSATVAVSRLNAQNIAEQNKMKADEKKRKAAFLRSLGKNPEYAEFAPMLNNLAGEQEDDEPAAPSTTPQSAPAMPQPAAPMSVQAPPALEIPRGKYGTPVAILDGLAETESGNNPIALGPIIPWKNGKTTRAEGMYQHLPDTRDMLRAQMGNNYDPFKSKEARDATDFYLMQLNKQHGGDWNKTLAAYGGFKTKDPTNYIQKVMGGSDEKQAVAHATNQNATQAVNPFASSQKLQKLAGILTFVDEDLGKGFEMMAKGAQPQKVEGGGMYIDPQRGMVRVPLTPEQQAEENRKTAAERRAVEDQKIQQDKADWEKSQRAAAEQEKKADIAKKEADAAKTNAEIKTAADTKANAQNTAKGLIGKIRGKLKELDDRGGIVNSETKGILRNVPAGLESTPLGQYASRFTGQKNQTIRDEINAARPLLMMSMAQALGIQGKQLDSVREFETYLQAASDPSYSVQSNRSALNNMELILTGKVPIHVKQADGTYKAMSLEEAKQVLPDAPTQPATKPERKFQVIR